MLASQWRFPGKFLGRKRERPQHAQRLNFTNLMDLNTKAQCRPASP